MKKSTISFFDFEKLDLRVGEVKEASILDGSKKIIRMLVDLGEDDGTVEILSGLAEFYSPEDLKGNKYIFLANLEPRMMMGYESQGMMLAADTENGPVFLTPSRQVPPGSKIR